MSTYTKPAKLDPDSMWVSVAEIHESDGHGKDEKSWGTEAICYRSTERAAIECAETWFAETDQSSDCDVTFSVARADGTIVQHRVEMKIEVVCRVKRQEVTK